MTVSILTTRDGRCSSLGLKHLSWFTLDLEVSLPHEGEQAVRPYENLGIVRMDSGSSRTPGSDFSRTPSHTRIEIYVPDGVLMRYACG
jgi:hypothetical protein